MSNPNSASRWYKFGLPGVLALLLLVGFSLYTSISQAVALGRFRIAATHNDIPSLRAIVLRNIEAAAREVLTTVAEHHHAGKPPRTLVLPQVKEWVQAIYQSDGQSLVRYPTLSHSGADTQNGLNDAIQNALTDDLRSVLPARVPPIRSTMITHNDHDIVLMSIVIPSARIGPVVLAVVADAVDVRKSLIDPLLKSDDPLDVVTRADRSVRYWSEPLVAGLPELYIQPAPAFIQAQGQRVLMQVGLYAAVSALLVVSLLLMLRKFVGILQREVALSELKSSFVADVSHELKTPLALIRMFSEMLSENRVPSDEKKIEYYNIINRECSRLTNLIDNILDFSRIDAGKKTYDFQKVEIADVVRATYDTYRIDLDHHGFTHTLHVDDELPPIDADADAISQVILNLISNAIKYSGDEKRLDIDIARETRRGKHGVVILVKDAGIGIKPEDRAHLFDGFFRAGGDHARRVRGAGLGLAVAKQIVEAHGGLIDVESRLVKGTTFRIFLPQSAHEEDAQSPKRPRRAEPAKGS